MATPSFDDSMFLLAHCSVCAADTLTHLGLGPEDDLIRCCVHCDAPVVSPLIEVSSEELEDRGYSVIEARTCGNGGGCGSGCGTRAQH
ncbi:MAG: hypothetical protein HY270_24710 [Deltaproteobacteria bacterium]|nr:hypothetical protein [Deltaproteobacteria bacterium]